MAKKVQEELNLFYMNKSGADKKAAPRKEKRKKYNSKNIQQKNQVKNSANKLEKKLEKNIIYSKKNNVKNTKIKNLQKSNKKRKISKKKVFVFVAKWTTLLALLIGSFVFLTTTPIFNIKNINIIGNNQVSYDQILSLSSLSKDVNLFKNSKSKIIKNIKQNAYINNVTIKRKLPDTIEINIEEKQKTYMLKFINGYAYIDNQGYILEISDKNLVLPILKGYITSEEDIVEGNRLCNDDLEKLQTTIKIMQSIKDVEIQSEITNIDISNKQDYKLYIKSENKIIYLGDASNLTDKMLYVKAIIEAEKGNEGEIFLNGDLNNKFKPYFREKV